MERRCGWVPTTLAGPPVASGATTVPSSAMSSTGTTTSTSRRLRTPASTIVTGRGVIRTRPVSGSASPSGSGRAPPRNSATSDNGRWVADSAIRCGGSAGSPSGPSRVTSVVAVPNASVPPRSTSSSSRSSDRARWVPRLRAAIAWISSTMTVSSVRRVSRAREVR
jgi:hypothetical protein